MELSFEDVKKAQKYISRQSTAYKNRVCYPKSFHAFFTDNDLRVYSHLLEAYGSCIYNKKHKNAKRQLNDDFSFAISITEIAKEEGLYKKIYVSRSLHTLEKFGLITWNKIEKTSRGNTGTCHLNFPVIYACTCLSKLVWEIQKEMPNQNLGRFIKEILTDEKKWGEIIKTDYKFNNFLLQNGIKKMEEEKIIGNNTVPDKKEKEEKKEEKNELSGTILLPIDILSGTVLLPIDILSGTVLLPMVWGKASTRLFWAYPMLYYYLCYIKDMLFFKRFGAFPSEPPCAKNHRARKSDIENFKYIFSPKGMEEILPKLIEQKNGEVTKMENLLEKEKSPIQESVNKIFSSWYKLPNTVKHQSSSETYKAISTYLENLLLGKPMLCGKTGKLKKDFANYGKEKNIPKEFLRRKWSVKEIISILRKLTKRKEDKTQTTDLKNLLWRQKKLRDENSPKEFYSEFLECGAANMQEGIKPYRELAQMFYDAFTKQRKYSLDSAVLILYSFAIKNNLSFDDMKIATEFILQENTSFKPKVISVLEFTEKYDGVLDSMRRWEQDNKKKQSGISFSSGTILQDLKKLKGD